MKTSFRILIGLFSLSLIPTASLSAEANLVMAPNRMSLAMCFEGALKRSELVASQGQLIKQAEESYHQVIGSVLPTVSGVGAYQWQQNNAGSFATLYPSPATSTKLMLNQPLFQGFKEYAGLRQSKTLVKATQFDKKQAATLLYQDTTASYFAVASYEHDIDNVKEELAYYDRRIAELNQFVSIGRSQVTDVLTAKAQQAALSAQLKLLNGQLRAQRAVLSFLTGFDPEVAIRRPVEEGIALQPLKDYLSRIDERPDVRGDLERTHSADDGISVARAGHYPTLGLQADYYLERTGALKDVNWDVILALTVPIFSGGIVQAQVEQATSRRDQADLQVSRTRRLAEQQIRQFYESFLGDKEQFAAYMEATELAEKNYKAETRNYRLGLVTNLDVLQALTTFQESKRSYDRARYAMLQDFENLQAAAAYKPGPVTP